MNYQNEPVGVIVRRLRRSKGLNQAELACRAGMLPSQLCKLELGRNGPTEATLKRLAEALDVRVSELLGEESAGAVAAIKEAPLSVRAEDYERVLITAETEEEVADARAAAKEYDNQVGAIERSLNISLMPSCQFVYSFGADGRSAEMCARAMRLSLGVGFMPLHDLEMILETHNIRIVKVNLPRRFQSASFYNRKLNTFSIVLNKVNTAERNTYRLAYELGAAVLSAGRSFAPMADAGEVHQFLRSFTSAFLMPEEMVRIQVQRYGIGPTDWTMDILRAIKMRFYVSAETFARRLEELGLIEPNLRLRLRDELHQYYEAHPTDMEPRDNDTTLLKVLTLIKEIR